MTTIPARNIDGGQVAIEKAGAELCHLERLAVLPQARKKGRGRRLVEHVFRKARKVGAKTISIGIIAEQTDLKQWYSKIEFIEGETKAFDHLPFQVTFMTFEF